MVLAHYTFLLACPTLIIPPVHTVKKSITNANHFFLSLWAKLKFNRGIVTQRGNIVLKHNYLKSDMLHPHSNYSVQQHTVCEEAVREIQTHAECRSCWNYTVFIWINDAVNTEGVNLWDHMMYESQAAQHWVSSLNRRGFDTRTNFHYRRWNAECNFNEAFS